MDQGIQLKANDIELAKKITKFAKCVTCTSAVFIGLFMKNNYFVFMADLLLESLFIGFGG